MSVDERIPFLRNSRGSQERRPRLLVVLSRPTYRCGNFVVGTIRLECDHLNSICDLAQSLHVYVAGRCRVDPRWHDCVTINHLYGTHPCLAGLPVMSTAHIDSDRGEGIVGNVNADERSSSNYKSSPSIDDVATNLYFELSRSSSIFSTVAEHCVCFWSTNVVSLLDDAKHRCTPTLEQILDWKNPPVPLILEESHWFKRGSVYVELMKSQKNVPLENIVSLDDYISSDDHLFEQSATSVPTSQDDACTNIREVQSRLDYTFYAQLPIDIPPSVYTACTRYFYSVVVYAKTTDGETLVTVAPFTVIPPFLTCESSQSAMAISPTTRVKIGQCVAFEHSNALPCYISPTTIIEPISISSEGNFKFNPLFLSDTQTFPVIDTDTEKCCCSLTVIGISVLSPNGEIFLQFNFEDDCDVVLVSACLQGEEIARTTHHGTSEKRVRSYLFDTSHSYVESGYSQFTQLSLRLPCDAPFSIQTDLVEVRINCRVDVTVKKEGFESGYGVLTLELPCKVWPVAPQRDETNSCELSDEIKQAYFNIVRNKNEDLPIDMIFRDLTNLSLYMKEREAADRGTIPRQ